MLSIAVGVFAFASVFITEEVLVSEMDTQYAGTNPSQITLYVNSYDDSMAKWAKSREEIKDAQVRARHNLKLVTEEETYNLELYVYGDFENISVNRLALETGTWPSERRTIVLERTTMEAIGARPGDSVTIETQDGTRYALTVTGSIHDINAIPVNISPELSGYISVKTTGWLGLPAVYNRLDIVPENEYDTLEELEAVAQDLRQHLQQDGMSIGIGISSQSGEHWAMEVTESFTIILSFIGFFALALSGFLVVNTMSALMLEQRKQIGMMKALGGRGRQIMGLYMTLVAIYGLLALVVAVPVGFGLAYIFTQMVAGFINLDIMNFHLPIYVLLLQVLAAFFVPVIAAAIPVRGGIRVSVREAVGNHGIKVKERHGWLDRIMFRIRALPRPVLLSLRNSFRKKGRLLLTLGTLTLAGTLFISVINVRTSLTAELDNVLDTLFNYEAQLYFNGNYPATGVQNRTETVDGVVVSGSETGVSAQLIRDDGSEGTYFNIAGIQPESDFVQPKMLSGQWLDSTDRKALVISSRLLEDMPGTKTGDILTLNIRGREYEWKVAGIMLMSFERIAFADFDYVSSIRGTPGLASSMFVRTGPKDGESQEHIAAVIEQKLKDAGVGVAYSITKDTIVSYNSSQFDFLISFLLSMAVMSALIGGLGLAGMMGLSVMERTREIGVIRSVGASNLAVGGIVITEGLLIGLISWILSIPLSIPVSIILNALMGNIFLDQPLMFTFSFSGMFIWLMIVMVISIIASLLPARRAVKMSVRETLAYE